MLEAQAAYERAGLDFGKHAVAVTGDGQRARQVADEARLARALSRCGTGSAAAPASCRAVGLLPAALQGIDIDAMLAGAAAMDAVTRVHETRKNPAALLALVLVLAPATARARRTWSILPYKDRLELFSRYLQQLVMESLGKEHDLDGKVVQPGHRGLRQQGLDRSARLRAAAARRACNNFFVTFIEVLRDRDGKSLSVEDGVTSGDYLVGLLPRHAARAVRKRSPVDHDHASTRRRARRRRADRAVRARRRLLRVARRTSTPTTSPASKPARRRPARCSTLQTKILTLLGERNGKR